MNAPEDTTEKMNIMDYTKHIFAKCWRLMGEEPKSGNADALKENSEKLFR